MNDNLGWIKLHRALLDKTIWINSTAEQKTILITLLLMANHEPNQWEWKGKKYIVKSGEFITSLEKIVAKCGKGITTQNVRSALKRFEKLQFLTNESTKQNRLIKIENWGLYQDEENQPNKATNKEVTNDQQRGNKEVTTNKNDKNDKNDKNILYTLVQKAWNDLSENIPKINFIKENSTRSKHLDARIEEVGEEKFIEVLKSVSNSDFLCGKNKNNWTITFDWFINASNFVKVMEGNYKNKISQKQDNNEFKGYGELI